MELYGLTIFAENLNHRLLIGSKFASVMEEDI